MPSHERNWHVERFRLDDRAALLALHCKVFTFATPEKYQRHWSWKYLGNPHAVEAVPTIWVVRQGDQIVGSIAANPAALRVGSEVRVAHWAQDLAVDPAWRGRGLANALFAALRAAGPLGLGIGAPPRARPSLVARTNGFAALAPQKYLFKVYRVAPLLHRFGLPGAGLTSFLETLITPWHGRGTDRLASGPRDLELTEGNALAEEIDELCQRATIGTVHVVRDHRTLAWRYRESPLFRYTTLLARRAGKVVGLVVFKLVDTLRIRYGVIAELLVSESDPDVAQALLAGALERMKGGDVDVVKSLASRPFLQRVFRGFGFVALGRSCNVIVRDDEPALLAPSTAWYLSKGDSDLDLRSTSPR